MVPSLTPLRITAIYLVFGGIWILFSDQLVRLLIDTPEWRATVQTLKGWLYVAVTGGLVYALTDAPTAE
jgi:Na+-driven multidrug efflux pump